MLGNQTSLAQGQHYFQWPFSLWMENEKVKNKIGSTCRGNTSFGSVSLPTAKMSMKVKKKMTEESARLTHD